MSRVVLSRAEYHDKQRDQARREFGKRDAAILARRAADWTLERIGLKYGITKERVRQILRRVQAESARHRE